MSSLSIKLEDNRRHVYYDKLVELFNRTVKNSSKFKYVLEIPKGFNPLIAHNRLCEKIITLCENIDWDVVHFDKEAKENVEEWDILNNGDHVIIYNGLHKTRPSLIRLGSQENINDGDYVQIAILRNRCFSKRYEDGDDDIPFTYFIAGVVVAFLFVYVAHNVTGKL